jgi:hypothetical protein
MSEATARFQVSPDVVTREIDEGLLLVNLQSGATWKLNRVGADVCRRLDGATDVGAIVAALEQHYKVGIETLRQDVDGLLEDLQRQGLVEPAAAAG